VPNRVGIENRPAVVDQKSRIGDWEADTIVGKGQKSALLILVERVTRKQTDFRNISDREIRRVQDELNHRPRKTLGYETPSVLFLNLFQPLIH